MQRENSIELYRGCCNKVIKTATTDYSVFKCDYIKFSKEVDKPEEYYFKGDEITFTIKLKNVGDKIITKFCIKEEVACNVGKINNSYVVTSTDGCIDIDDNVIKVKDIDICPDEEVIVTITGIVL